MPGDSTLYTVAIRNLGHGAPEITPIGEPTQDLVAARRAAEAVGGVYPDTDIVVARLVNPQWELESAAENTITEISGISMLGTLVFHKILTDEEADEISDEEVSNMGYSLLVRLSDLGYTVAPKPGDDVPACDICDEAEASDENETAYDLESPKEGA